MDDASLLESCRTFARSRMKKFHSSHGWDHVERVVTMSRVLAAREPGTDPFIVEAAAILHDIAREDENGAGGALCHAEKGSELAAEFLTRIGLDATRVDRITHCIRAHRFRDDAVPESIEAKVLYDADKLDSIGAVGIGRAFLFSGEIGARLHNPAVDVTATEAYSYEDTAYREFMVKMRYIRDRMLTGSGRAMAGERHRFMVAFFTRLDSEVRGER